MQNHALADLTNPLYDLKRQIELKALARLEADKQLRKGLILLVIVV
jgi:hypothetical protein